MYTVSNRLREVIQSGKKAYVKVKCGNFIYGYDDETDPNNPVDLHNVMELNIDRTAATDKCPLGTSYACGADCVLWDVPSNAILRGQKTSIYLGYMVDGVVEWIPMGVYCPEKPTRSGQCTTLKMYDKMYDLSIPYSAAISGEQTPLAILQDLARQGAFELDASVSSKIGTAFDKINVSLLCGEETNEDGSKTATAYNVNDCIGFIAGFCGCSAIFNREGKLQLYTFTQTYDGNDAYTITDDTVSEVSISEEDYRIQGIQCNNGTETLIAPAGLSANATVLDFDNPLITKQAQAEKTFNAFADYVYAGENEFDIGFQYRPGAFSWLCCNPALDCFDIIVYKDEDNVEHRIPVMSIQYYYDGSVVCDIAAFALSEQESNASGSIITRMFTKTVQQLTQPLVTRIQAATDSITTAVGGYVSLVDTDGDKVPDNLIAGEYPVDLKTGSNWRTKGNCVRINHNGIAVSTTGADGPFTHFAVYYDEAQGKYLVNADDIATGVLSGIKIIAERGLIGGWEITPQELCSHDNGKPGTYAGLSKYGTGPAFWAGCAYGWQGTAPFRVTHEGHLYAANADIAGKITASSGTIGEWTVDSSGNLYKDENGYRTRLRPASSANEYALEIQHYENGNYITKSGIKADGTALFSRELDVAVVNCSGILYMFGAKRIRFGSSAAEYSRIEYAQSTVNGSAGNRLNIYSFDHGMLIDSGSGTTHFQNDHANFYNPVYFKSTAYTSSGATVTSDERLKNTIQPLAEDERYIKFFDALTPVSFKYNDGTSGRTHMGMIAQEVKEALKAAGFTTQEVAAFVQYQQDEFDTSKTDDGTVCALRYEEFTALNTAVIQKQQKELNTLHEELNTLHEEIAELKAMLAASKE